MTMERIIQGPGAGPAGLDLTTGEPEFGWEIGPAGFPVQVEVTEDYVQPEMPYQGPSAVGFEPGPSAVYLGTPPAELPWLTVPGALIPAGGIIPGEAVIGYPELSPAEVGGGGPLGFVAGLAIDYAIDVATQKGEAYIERKLGGADMANGVDLYGHEGMVQNGGMVPVGGPGVPEPPAAMVAKYWKTKAFSKTKGEYWVHFWKLIDGRIMCYNAAKREWKMWRPKKPIVLYRGKVTLSQAVRAQRMLDKLWKTVAKRTKALKLA